MKVFIDMDGVLSDFNKSIIEKFGTKKEWKQGGIERWELLPEDFFLSLPKMTDADELVNHISGQFDWHVLSAIPDEPVFPECRRQKMQWVFEHYKLYPVRVHCVYQREKQYYAAEENLSPNILIDDSESNVAEWKAKGGIAILHTSANDSIRELQQLGF
jgi:5'(3')-deoxyribonucleotidase|tara:strand:+ start:10809 stop:11285 length:477 start_codon:yes stop_codon:yes gene_type:complete